MLKLSPLPEESSTLLSTLLPPDSRSPSTLSTLVPLMTSWTESTNASIQEEESSSLRRTSWEPPYLTSRPTSPSLNPSDSLDISDPLLQDKPSLNASSIIGKSLDLIRLIINPSLMPSAWPSERERELNKSYPSSLTSLINNKMPNYVINNIYQKQL